MHFAMSSRFTFFFYCYVDHRDLHSFPTRRSSDLYEMFLILDSFARIRKGKEPSVNYLRERLLPAYREWHAANPFKARPRPDRKSTRLNSSHVAISYAVFCLKKKKQHTVS